MYNAQVADFFRYQIVNLPFDLTVDDVDVEYEPGRIRVVTMQSGGGRRFSIWGILNYLPKHDFNLFTLTVKEEGDTNFRMIPPDSFVDQADIFRGIREGMASIVRTLLHDNDSFFRDRFR